MTDDDLTRLQRAVCRRYGASFVEANGQVAVGVAKDSRTGLFPIQGFRRRVEGESSGWHIWAGEVMSDAADFFRPISIIYLDEWCAGLKQYLALAPGWRFRIDRNGEHVWEDRSLLGIEG
jgi:hypothetical protein